MTSVPTNHVASIIVATANAAITDPKLQRTCIKPRESRYNSAGVRDKIFFCRFASKYTHGQKPVPGHPSRVPQLFFGLSFT